MSCILETNTLLYVNYTSIKVIKDRSGIYFRQDDILGTQFALPSKATENRKNRQNVWNNIFTTLDIMQRKMLIWLSQSCDWPAQQAWGVNRVHPGNGLSPDWRAKELQWAEQRGESGACRGNADCLQGSLGLLLMACVWGTQRQKRAISLRLAQTGRKPGATSQTAKPQNSPWCSSHKGLVSAAESS